MYKMKNNFIMILVLFSLSFNFSSSINLSGFSPYYLVRLRRCVFEYLEIVYFIPPFMKYAVRYNASKNCYHSHKRDAPQGMTVANMYAIFRNAESRGRFLESTDDIQDLLNNSNLDDDKKLNKIDYKKKMKECKTTEECKKIACEAAKKEAKDFPQNEHMPIIFYQFYLKLKFSLLNKKRYDSDFFKINCFNIEQKKEEKKSNLVFESEKLKDIIDDEESALLAFEKFKISNIDGFEDYLKMKEISSNGLNLENYLNGEFSNNSEVNQNENDFPISSDLYDSIF